jgi:hypothetical protein
VDWAMLFCGITLPTLIGVLQIGWWRFVPIAHLLIIRWIVWMGSRQGERGLARHWGSYCELCFVQLRLCLDFI